MAMPAIYVNAAIEYLNVQGKKEVNVLWYRCSGSPTGGGANAVQEVMDNIDQEFADPFKDWLCIPCVYLGVRGTLHVNGVAYSGESFGTTGNGNRTGDTLPAYAAGLCKKITDTAGKEGRGRWYLGCVPEPLTNSSIFTSAGSVAFNTIMQVFMHNIAAAGMSMTPQHHSAKAQTLVPIVAARPVLELATQRRRRFRGL